MNTSNINIVPREVLFGNPERLAPQISPDGTMLSFLAPLDGVMNIWIGKIDKNEYYPITKNTQRGVFNYFWGQDLKHILFLQDVGGDENWHLHSVNIYTGEWDDLTPFDGVQTKIAEHDMHFPYDVMLAMNFDNPEYFDVFHLDLRTKKLTKITENPGHIISWEVDTQLQVRGAFTATDEGGYTLWVTKDIESEWFELINWDFEDSQNIAIETFSKDGKFIYLKDSRNSNTIKLIKVEIETGNEEIIFQDNSFDISHMMVHPETYEIQMVSITKERTENIVLDPEIKEDVENISKLNNGDFIIYDRDNSDKKWLIGFTQDNGPASYYLYDRDEKKGYFLFHNKPNLLNYDLCLMESFSFTSRDGLEIYGYITFPNTEKKENLPMVLNVHGGPWLRDTWGWNPEVQWITNRGYICLQVNYRGSAGYGKKFQNAGDKEWGGKMHNDLIDAVNWSIEKGYVNPEKIAIFGTSYGGYSALVGLTFTPDVFCCGIDIVGPSNLITLINNIPPYWKAHLENLKKRVGNPKTEEEFLKSRSPLFKVENIKSPILIAQGGNDPRVKQYESEQIVKAMKKNGIYYEYILFPDEGHGFVHPENKMKFYAIAEKFLAKYLGGNYEEIEKLETFKNKGGMGSIFD